jgi:hypothetical protein
MVVLRELFIDVINPKECCVLQSRTAIATTKLGVAAPQTAFPNLTRSFFAPY